jgi:hypothetical protein
LNNIIADPDAHRNPNAFQVHDDFQFDDADENSVGIQNPDEFQAHAIRFNEYISKVEIPLFGYRLLGNKLQAFISHVNNNDQNYLHFLEFQLNNKKEPLLPTVLFSIRIQPREQYLDVGQSFVL